MFLVFFVAIFIVFSYSYLTRHDDAFAIRTELYDLSGECSLSLCDCQCYKTDKLPELVEGKICGNDCFGLLGIDGCELINDSCVVSYK